MVERPAVIHTQHLRKVFGELVAVDRISLDIRAGEIFGVLGPNGAGKSTTIRMLAGILVPSAGEGTVVGYDIRTQSEQIKQNIGYMTQRFSLYEDLTVKENLDFYGGLYGLKPTFRRGRIETLTELHGLGERLQQITGTLSGGWKQRVALACATIHAPPLLFLDEPTAGVDPVSRRSFWNQIHHVAQNGTTVLVTTHYMDEAERCHRLAFIFKGNLLDVGTPAEIIERRQLQSYDIECSHPRQLGEVLSALPEVDDVAYMGQYLRILARGPKVREAVERAAQKANLHWGAVNASRPNVEDAFVSMVRTERE